MEEQPLAKRLFKATLFLNSIEGELIDVIEDLTSNRMWDNETWQDLTWDWYDESLEFKQADPEFRLSPEQQKAIWELGFQKVWICHTDGWETYYRVGLNEEGYRFQYPIDK